MEEPDIIASLRISQGISPHLHSYIFGNMLGYTQIQPFKVVVISSLQLFNVTNLILLCNIVTQ